MTRHNDLVERVKAAGARLTPQRLLILQALAQNQGHTSVDHIFATVQKAYPYMDVTTVYRTLQLLKKLGVVAEVSLGDKLHFELVTPDHQHHHLVCTVCGGDFALPPQYLDRLRDSLVSELGFEPNLTHLIISGTCAKCKQAVQKAEA